MQAVYTMTKIEGVEFKKIQEEYNINPLFSEYGYFMQLFNSLGRQEKAILILYAELGSFRKVGDVLGISHTVIKKIIDKIKCKIRYMYEYGT